MVDDKNSSKDKHERKSGMRDNGMMGGIYGMAFIGGAIYYIGHAVSFWGGVLGFFKALFWPAVLMYKILELLNM